MATCKECGASFEITDRDLAFYDKISPVIGGKKYAIPPPKLCPSCRQQRRLAFYNRRQLYKRTCDFSGQPIISIYSPDKPFKVYDKKIWFSDKWDPMDYGRPFDFSRPFFEQFRELMIDVPMLSLTLLGEIENSEFNNDNFKLKNCYLTFDGAKGEDAYYGESFVSVRDSVDFLFLEKSELCYECINCQNCYNVKFSRFCKSCSDAWFLKDCSGCRNCFGCVNLHDKEFYIYNKPYTKEQYKEFLAGFNSGSHSVIEQMRQKVEEFYLTQPVRALHGVSNENVIGDNLNHCKNAFYCFDSNYLQDCEYVSDDQVGGRDLWDIDIWGEAIELCYNSCVIGANLRNVMAGYYISEGGHDIFYSIFCSRNIDHLFGCSGLRHHRYCILNKQYTPEAYEATVAKIITHMQKTGEAELNNQEWGEYFPPEISAFGYNETVAQDHYPMNREEVRARGWQWKDDNERLPNVSRVIKAAQLPDTIAEIPDEITDWAIECEATGRPFKITAQELKFYRAHNLPIPHFHPDVRHRKRMAMRNPHHLWERVCAKCGADIQTSYAPDRPEIVYCEKCYLEAVQ